MKRSSSLLHWEYGTEIEMYVSTLVKEAVLSFFCFFLKKGQLSKKELTFRAAKSLLRD